MVNPRDVAGKAGEEEASKWSERKLCEILSLDSGLRQRVTVDSCSHACLIWSLAICWEAVLNAARFARFYSSNLHCRMSGVVQWSWKLHNEAFMYAEAGLVFILDRDSVQGCKRNEREDIKGRTIIDGMTLMFMSLRCKSNTSWSSIAHMETFLGFFYQQKLMEFPRGKVSDHSVSITDQNKKKKKTLRKFLWALKMSKDWILTCAVPTPDTGPVIYIWLLVKWKQWNGKVTSLMT